jgi:hypothetical protein
MTRIICTGRPGHGGIAASLKKFYPDAYFVNRSNGYDLTENSDYSRFRELIKGYNVFINHSQIELGFQEKVLRDVFDIWSKNNVRGHIISIGSIIELDEWAWLDKKTSEEKLEIRNTSLKLNCEMIKTTHMIVSGFNRYGPEDDVKIDPDDIVKTIRLILESEVDMPLVYVEKTNDARLKKWRDLKSI